MSQSEVRLRFLYKILKLIVVFDSFVVSTVLWFAALDKKIALVLKYYH